MANLQNGVLTGEHGGQTHDSHAHFVHHAPNLRSHLKTRKGYSSILLLVGSECVVMDSHTTHKRSLFNVHEERASICLGTKLATSLQGAALGKIMSMD